jgi:hypothetical protein
MPMNGMTASQPVSFMTPLSTTADAPRGRHRHEISGTMAISQG